MVKDQIKAKDARHFMELEANSILAHIELIEELEKGSFNLKSKKKKLEAKLLLAKEELSQIKVASVNDQLQRLSIARLPVTGSATDRSDQTLAFSD
ncbi:hypothetical protein HID58_073875 [Brassica napus]|uniref:Uncharacterized protein n=1 Tax=Brassica napus TaxID=3708 RepID=A0ABQ7YF28_BRANA|nr:hypothetical protein HID58_073875 [Brassica napus]